MTAVAELVQYLRRRLAPYSPADQRAALRRLAADLDAAEGRAGRVARLIAERAEAAYAFVVAATEPPSMAAVGAAIGVTDHRALRAALRHLEVAGRVRVTPRGVVAVQGNAAGAPAADREPGRGSGRAAE